MNKNEFREKIESGQMVSNGCLTFYKLKGIYYYSHPKAHYNSVGIHSFDTFDTLWEEIGHFLLYGVDYDSDRGKPDLKALVYDSKQFNCMANRTVNRNST